MSDADLMDFNPRSPHGERRDIINSVKGRYKFQSTLPARGATPIPFCYPRPGGYFNPRSPHGERLRASVDYAFEVSFQSTLPARGATLPGATVRRLPRFQSTLPARGATCGGQRHGRSAGMRISIHAPRTGSDRTWSPEENKVRRFQSTLPARGATSK